jgi:hypothetical protein
MQSNSSLWFHGTTPNYLQFQVFEYIKNLGWKLIIIPLDYHLDFPWPCFVPLALLSTTLVFVDTKTMCAIGVLDCDFYFIFLRGLSMVWSLGCDLLDGPLLEVHVFSSSVENTIWSLIFLGQHHSHSNSFSPFFFACAQGRTTLVVVGTKVQCYPSTLATVSDWGIWLQSMLVLL